MRGSFALLLVPALLSGAVVGCGDSPTQPAIPTSLELDVDELDLVRGETGTLTLRIRDQNGDIMTAPSGFQITWQSSNHSVASVSDGQVTAHAVGSATITAQAPELSAVSATVRIVSPEYEGSIAFEYEGDREGSFSASGDYRFESDGALTTPQWAFSYFDDEIGFQVMIGFRSVSAELGDLIILLVDHEVTAPATHDWDFGACILGDATKCAAFGALFFGLDSEGEADADIYFLDKGTIDFATVQGSRLTGTFEASGALEEDESTNPEAPIEVANGSFDLPVVPVYDLGPVSEDAAPMAAAIRAAREAVRLAAPYRAH